MGKRAVRIHIDEELLDKIDELAAAEDRSRNWMVIDLIRQSIGVAQPTEKVAADMTAQVDESAGLHRHRRWSVTGRSRPGQGTNRGFQEAEWRCVDCPEGKTKWDRVKA